LHGMQRWLACMSTRLQQMVQHTNHRLEMPDTDALGAGVNEVLDASHDGKVRDGCILCFRSVPFVYSCLCCTILSLICFLRPLSERFDSKQRCRLWSSNSTLQVRGHSSHIFAGAEWAHPCHICTRTGRHMLCYGSRGQRTIALGGGADGAPARSRRNAR
jgi:hypothetical protein